MGAGRPLVDAFASGRDLFREREPTDDDHKCPTGVDYLDHDSGFDDYHVRRGAMSRRLLCGLSHKATSDLV